MSIAALLAATQQRHTEQSTCTARFGMLAITLSAWMHLATYGTECHMEAFKM